MILWEDNVKQCVLCCLWTCGKLWEEDSYLALARHKSLNQHNFFLSVEKHYVDTKLRYEEQNSLHC